MREFTLALFIIARIAGAQESAAALTATQIDEDLKILGTALASKWSYAEDKRQHSGVEIEQLVAEVRNSVGEPPVRKDRFADALEVLVAGLKDGHAYLSLPGAEPGVRLKSWPFTLRIVREGYAVTGVAPGAGDLRRGDIVRRVDGISMDDHVTRSLRRTPASSDGTRLCLALEDLHETDRDQVRLDVQRTDGSAAAFNARCGRAPESPPASTAPADLGDGVWLLRVPTFTVEDWDGWRKAKVEERDRFLAESRRRIDDSIRTISSAKALILDLRGNRGGTDLLGIHLAKRLLPGTFVYYGLSSRTGDAKSSTEWSKPHFYKHHAEDGAPVFHGRLILLIDELCFSAADNFIACVAAQRKDLVIVGRPTHGGTGAPGVLSELPHSGAAIGACTMRVYAPGGTLIEGRGTKPHVDVTWTRDDVAAGRDPDLEAALRATRQ